MSSVKDFPPREPISVRSLPATLKAMNDARESRLPSTAFGVEQEAARLVILSMANRLIGRARVAPATGLRDDAVALATATREFMVALAASPGDRKNDALQSMRDAVERMNKQHGGGK